MGRNSPTVFLLGLRTGLKLRRSDPQLFFCLGPGPHFLTRVWDSGVWDSHLGPGPMERVKTDPVFFGGRSGESSRPGVWRVAGPGVRGEPGVRDRSGTGLLSAAVSYKFFPFTERPGHMWRVANVTVFLLWSRPDMADGVLPVLTVCSPRSAG